MATPFQNVNSIAELRRLYASRMKNFKAYKKHYQTSLATAKKAKAGIASQVYFPNPVTLVLAKRSLNAARSNAKKWAGRMEKEQIAMRQILGRIRALEAMGDVRAEEAATKRDVFTGRSITTVPSGAAGIAQQWSSLSTPVKLLVVGGGAFIVYKFVQGK